MKARNWTRLVIIVVAVAALLSVGSQLRAQLGIDFSAEGIRAWVEGLGLLGMLEVAGDARGEAKGIDERHAFQVPDGNVKIV